MTTLAVFSDVGGRAGGDYTGSQHCRCDAQQTTELGEQGMKHAGRSQGGLTAKEGKIREVGKRQGYRTDRGSNIVSVKRTNDTYMQIRTLRLNLPNPEWAPESACTMSRECWVCSYSGRSEARTTRSVHMRVALAVRRI
jgi:hypothetical protein